MSKQPWLSKAAAQFREQLNDNFPNRSKRLDGWIGDLRHQSRGSKSQHNPNEQGEVCALDVDAGLSEEQGIAIYLADQIRLAAKQGDRRFLYIIFMGKICSAKSLWRWRKYTGLNPHNKHIHISFKPNQNGKPFNIPLLGGTDETIKKA
jgi:hypothetical protein